ncbi:RWD domain-containing protein 3-like [Actinia tenebrosa]|uniref:RWD domain-containing protein 3 n=1 Tax=Actinia tenebrosa TaxID=6105 RepID=A0A6P8J472_ACTTE|nr:RWD domain-containing protein 3-like [Actinia tenebrosa]
MIMESTNIELIKEEIEALKAIFCEEGEFSINSNVIGGIFSESDRLSISLDLQVKCSTCSSAKNRETCKIKMTVALSKDYPGVLPSISLSSYHFNKKEVALFTDKLHFYLKTLHPGPIIMDLAMWLQENSVHTSPQSHESGDKSDDNEDINELVVVKLDHMRNRTCYLKTLTAWANDLDISIMVLFAHKLILLVFEGSSDHVKEFLKRFRSSNIDVDSSRKPCKEKMMKILVQIRHPTKLGSAGLNWKESKSNAELENNFKEFNLLDIYSKFVLPSL